MKKILWKPTTVSWQIHVIIALVAIIGLAMVELFRVNVKQPHYEMKYNAARTMKRAMDDIKEHRQQEDLPPIDRKIDPTASGLIGIQTSPITSAPVDIAAKVATLNPNWAAVVVQMLRESKVRTGSTVAVSFTGSFPALNCAVLAAGEAMKLRMIVITSVSSSTWGANIPAFTWLDMERLLVQKNIIKSRSVAASLGGVQDNARGQSEEGRRLIREAIRRNGLPIIEREDLKANIDSRMDLYYERAGDKTIDAFINVGGGTVVIGSYIGKMRYKPGVNLRPSRKAMEIESVISRFARAGVPVIHLDSLLTIANQYGLPYTLKAMPKVGVGEIFYRLEYNRLLVAGVLAVLVGLILVLIKMGYGYRMFSRRQQDTRQRPPEHMV